MEVEAIILPLVDALKKQTSVNSMVVECFIEVASQFRAKEDREPLVKAISTLLGEISRHQEATSSVIEEAMKALKSE